LNGVKKAIKGGANINSTDSGFQLKNPGYYGGKSALIFGFKIFFEFT
jgi:hypothetical protein